MNISHEHKCIFVHIPKAAGTSVKMALNLPGRGHPPWQYFTENFPEEWNSYIKFTVVRNPWDRVVSAYCYAKMENSFWHSNAAGLHPDYNFLKDKTFAQCCTALAEDRASLTHESWHPQYLWVSKVDASRKPLCMVDRVLRCESLGKDFSALCTILGAGPVTLPHINTSERKFYKKYYSARTRKLIARLYAADIQLFAYSY